MVSDDGSACIYVLMFFQNLPPHSFYKAEVDEYMQTCFRPMKGSSNPPPVTIRNVVPKDNRGWRKARTHFQTLHVVKLKR